MHIKVSAIVSSFNGVKYLPAFLENAAGQTIKDQLEIVLVHNQPSEEEVALVKAFQEKYPGLITHIIVPRELLAISMNRCIKAAQGEYVCIWNIDDLRTENSLELQMKVLDENSEVTFTYGDYIIVNQWQSQQGRLITEPEFEKREFIRSMHLGPFYMWRKSVCEHIGYFDEQCLQGADYELAVRLAVEYEGKKNQGLLGYYLDEGLGLSTKRATLQPIERTFIELRYGVYRKLDFLYYARAKKYRLDEVLEDGKWVPIDTLAPHRNQYVESKWWAVYAVVRYPFWILKRVINKFRRKLL